MNSSIYRFTLDLHSVQSQISIPVLLGETGRKFCISLSDGGCPYTITDGCLAKISIKRPTGTRLEDFCAIENNTTIVYSFEQNENTAAVEGIHDCDVTLYGVDGKSLCSPRFTMVVSERAVAEDDIVLTDEDLTAVDAMMVKEAERAEAERLREANETTRQESELNRELAENDRSGYELSRAEAEIARNEAEALRTEAELRRGQAFEDFKNSFSVDKSEFANAIKGNASGGVVSFNDVSPLEHNLKVNVSGVDDLSAVKVVKHGKNFFDASVIPTSTVIINNGDGSITIPYTGSGSQYSNRKLSQIAPHLKVGCTYTLSAVKNDLTVPLLYLLGTKRALSQGTFTFTEEDLDSMVYIYPDRDGHTDRTMWVQIEGGAIATEYEPYTGVLGEYAVNADGSTEGIASSYPHTTLTTDTVGAVISAEYNKDTNKVIENLVNAIISLGGNI